MSVLGRLKSYSVGRRIRREEHLILQRFSGESREITRDQWAESLDNPRHFYERAYHYYHTRLPKAIRVHRSYFETAGRGFGEKAFHVMWFLLFREFAPESFLEIGVFRGQTLSLASLLARHFGLSTFVQGISPFSNAGDAVSRYPSEVDYYQDTLANFSHFSLPAPSLLKAFSTDRSAEDVISSRCWSMIYIDGCHDYEVAKSDWALCSERVVPGGVIVLDDSGLTSRFTPPLFATAGHPGPSRLAAEIDRTKFREIMQVGHNRVFLKM